MGLSLMQIASALIKGPRWRNTSKCKKLIKQVKCSLMLKNKRRNAIVRQSRSDVSQFLRLGLLDIALFRVNQLYIDQCMLSAYIQLDQFCDCIYSNLGAITSHISELSEDVLEAVSSLIFAASRCGDVQQLHALRNLFRNFFGQAFERASVELLPGNKVHPQLKQNLNRKLVLTEDQKLQLLSDISKDVTLYLESSKSSGQVVGPESQMVRYNKINGSSNNYSSRSTNAAAVPAQKVNRQQANAFNRTNEVAEKPVTECHGLQNSEEIKEIHQGSDNSKFRLSHVHPKLPNYDDLVVKFTDIKRSFMRKNSDTRVIRKLDW